MSPTLAVVKNSQSEDFFSAYLHYCSDTEVPINFHRWAVLTSLGAFLGRQFYFQHGSFNVNPNMFTMLIGSPGTRKSTAIKLIKKLITEAGYENIAADKTSKEKFLLDLSGDKSDGPDLYGRAAVEQRKNVDKFLDENLWGNDDATKPDAEMFIMADEFNDFMGNGNIEFISLLGNLWDYSGTYKSRIKSGRSIAVNNPTVSILAGNTPTGFAQAFPPETLGQGFFSRTLLIYGEPSGRKITFPKVPDPAATNSIIQYIQLIKSKVVGPAVLTETASSLLERIYTSHTKIDDIRFESYYNRRFTHLLKLSLICSAARISTTIDERDVIYANTVLKHAEHSMPRALGEFGKSKNAEVSHKIIQLAESSDHILTYKEIWPHVSRDLEKMEHLSIILQNLVASEKLQLVPGGKGFLPKRAVISYDDDTTVNFSLLTKEERSMIS